jgi:hypothetical protein
VVARRRRIARVEHGDLSVEADRRPGNQGHVRCDACAIDRVPCREVIAAVEDDAGLGDECAQIVAADPLLDRLDCDFRIDCGEPGCRSGDLRPADVRCCVKDLPLQVGEVDVIGIAQRQRADAGGGQELRGRRPQSADTDHQRAGGRELCLRIRTELGQQDVAAVAEELGVVHPA